ncbi:MAG: LysE family translocator [Granulosicoccus sp.]
MSLQVWFPYLIACILIVMVPGPTVTVIIANSVRHGSRAGLANIAGTQAGIGLALVVLITGLASMMTFISQWFDVLRLIGAVYLIWLGIKLWRSDGLLVKDEAKPVRGGFFLQGFLVAVTNPKILLFFGAFIPQFIDPAVSTVNQLALLGLTFMAVAAFVDSCYALVAGSTGKKLSQQRVRLVERMTSSALMGGGLWLALARR